MKYVDLIGQPLKCEFLNDLFETYDVSVIYYYDRTNENMEDEYRASLPEMGLEFLFDASQRLTTIFMSPVEHAGYNPLEGNDPRDAPFVSAGEAVVYAKKHGIDAEHRPASSHAILGPIPEWVKLHYETYSIHYAFSDSGVQTVTLAIRDV